MGNKLRKINEWTTRIGVDLGALAAVVYGVEQLPALDKPAFAVVCGISAIGLYELDKLVANGIKKQGAIDSALKAATIAGVIGVSGYSLEDELQKVYQGFRKALVSGESEPEPKKGELGAGQWANEYGFQSPLGGNKQPKKHDCYRSEQGENKICPFDMYNAKTKEGRSGTHGGLDVFTKVGTTLYPIKPGKINNL